MKSSKGIVSDNSEFVSKKLSFKNDRHSSLLKINFRDQKKNKVNLSTISAVSIKTSPNRKRTSVLEIRSAFSHQHEFSIQETLDGHLGSIRMRLD